MLVSYQLQITYSRGNTCKTVTDRGDADAENETNN